MSFAHRFEQEDVVGLREVDPHGPSTNRQQKHRRGGVVRERLCFRENQNNMKQTKNGPRLTSVRGVRRKSASTWKKRSGATVEKFDPTAGLPDIFEIKLFESACESIHRVALDI